MWVSRTPIYLQGKSAYQTTRDVYKTKAAMTTVRMRPGTRPSTEYEYGNDMIAKQMYSEKRSAAVYTSRLVRLPALAN
jgi:hypothetical protein